MFVCVLCSCKQGFSKANIHTFNEIAKRTPRQGILSGVTHWSDWQRGDAGHFLKCDGRNVLFGEADVGSSALRGLH